MRLLRNWVGALILLSAGAAWAEEALLVADFDQTSPETFSFKDEKGSMLNASAAYPDEKKGKVLGIRYDILPEGFGGWGVAMKGADVSGYRYLAFDLHGDVGGETFEVGLRDTKGQERKRGIASFIDTPIKWQRVFIPLTEFAGVNLASLDNLSLGFGSKTKGRVFIDNISFEGSSVPGGVGGDLSNKVVVDGFDRTNPDVAYRTFSGDASIINVASSRVLYDGDYSMEIQYQLITDRPWGSWVSALRVPVKPLDWTGVDTVKIWVKGDGSENYFRFRFTQADGQIWEITNKKALSMTRWTQILMPISDFKLVGQPPRGTPPNLAGIKSYELAVVSPGASSTSGAKTSVGRIWVDLLTVSGERLQKGGIVPTSVPGTGGTAQTSAAPAGAGPRPQGVAGGNVDFSVIAYTEYLHTPEEQSQVNSNVKLITTGKLGDFSARVEFGSESQEFGQASAYIGSTTTATDNHFANIQDLSYQVFANNIHPAVSLVTLGNQFVDYGVDVMAPIWGFKGISGEGDWERFNYHAFVLKHSQNSFTAGARGTYYLPKWQFKYSGVYWEQTGKQTSASQIVDGQLEPPKDSNTLKLGRMAQDFVYNVNVIGRLLDEKLRLEGTYGYDSYVKYADGDFTDPLNPVFSQTVSPMHREGGSLWRTLIRTNELLVKGGELSYAYRDISDAYKPHYRQNPVYYDDTDSDQWGHTVKYIERLGGWQATGQYDTLRRHSNSKYYQHKSNWGLGYYGYRGIDVSVSQEYKRGVYYYTSDRSTFTQQEDDKIIKTEFYVRAQLTSRLAGWVKPTQERIWHPVNNGNYTLDIFEAQLEYYIANNAKFFAHHKITRYDNPDLEPQGTPFDDNFTRVSFEVTF